MMLMGWMMGDRWRTDWVLDNLMLIMMWLRMTA